MNSTNTRVSTGLAELDDILHGGLPPRRMYLVEGTPGTGKTTFGLQFLRDGLEKGEKVLYITLSETVEELDEVARGHGWSLDGITLFELGESGAAMRFDDNQSILHSWEAELTEVVKMISAQVEATAPARIVFDSLSELRLLSQEPQRFRRQILSLKQFFASQNVTVLLMDDMTAPNGHNLDLHSLAHGVLTMERLALDFGIARRRLQVQKLRGSAFREGFHDYAIRKGGLKVFPRLIASEHHVMFDDNPLASGHAQLDALLGGGPLRGTSTLITGPAGAGKTTLSLQYIAAACERGERSVVYEFDERIGTMLVRARCVGIDLQRHIDSGILHIRQIDPSEISPGEFTTMVRCEVRENHARVILIDSLNGYVSAMPQEKELVLQLHELLSFLNQQGVATFLIVPQMGLVGSMSVGTINISYIADAVILLRFFEANGRVRKALSVIKNRGNQHEDTIRELVVSTAGIDISAPLVSFNGILTGTPTYTGAPSALMLQEPEDEARGR
ncbi:ATPase domain-containing protein [Robbsia andropogonis]|uniref:ATPase domain-containing protein n=1 Tax=Robbsia andropogonis TaxID=28092 RepID=UPI002A6A2914|nr:ATPase domain-containing protein [Robbsia andropogonis]